MSKELKQLSDEELVQILQEQEDNLPDNLYFDGDTIIKFCIYTDGEIYYNYDKELIGDTWALALYCAEEFQI